MKRTVNFLLLVFASLIMSAQDTLYMNDGTRLQVKLIEVKDDVVRYKNWSNRNGPTLVKTRSSILEIKRGNINETMDFSHTQNFSEKEIVSYINFLYYSGIASRDIPQYVKLLPKNVSTKELGKYYFQRFEQAGNEEIEDDIIREGEIYLYIGEDKELPYVISILAKIYAKNGNEAKVNELIGKFKKFSKDNFDMFDDDIERLKKEIYDLLHPKLLKDEIVGTWVSLSADYHDESPLIIKIDDVMHPNGANMFLPDEPIKVIKNGNLNTISYKDKDKLKLNLSQSIYCDENYRVCMLQFLSLTIKDNTWLTGAAKEGIESVRKTGAEIHAILNSSEEATFGQKIGYGFLTDIGVAVISHLLSNMTKSSKEEIGYTFLLHAPSNYAIDGRMNHTSGKLDNDGNLSYKIEPTITKQEFVRLEESDSILFVSSNGKPIVTRPFSYDEPLLAEYNQIKQKTSFWRPQYCVPFFVGNAAGIGMMVWGISHSSKKNAVSVVLGGGAIFLLSNIVPECVRKHKRGNMFEDLNTRSYNKLKSKVATEVSFAPLYNPMDNTVGASVNLNF